MEIHCKSQSGLFVIEKLSCCCLVQPELYRNGPHFSTLWQANGFDSSDDKWLLVELFSITFYSFSPTVTKQAQQILNKCMQIFIEVYQALFLQTNVTAFLSTVNSEKYYGTWCYNYKHQTITRVRKPLVTKLHETYDRTDHQCWE